MVCGERACVRGRRRGGRREFGGSKARAGAGPRPLLSLSSLFPSSPGPSKSATTSARLSDGETCGRGREDERGSAERAANSRAAGGRRRAPSLSSLDSPGSRPRASQSGRSARGRPGAGLRLRAWCVVPVRERERETAVRKKRTAGRRDWGGRVTVSDARPAANSGNPLH